MNCLGSQSRGYESMPDDSGSTLPPTSTSESASTDNFTPSTTTSTGVEGGGGAAAVIGGAASRGIVGGAPSIVAPPQKQRRPTSRERRSAERLRGRRANGDAHFGHHHHHQHHPPVGHLKDTVLCPTCRGQGKVPKEKEGHLVALIPADDERLRPSKTKTYVFIAVVTSLILAFLTIFFIYPRSFNLQSKGTETYLYPIDLYINTTAQVVQFKVQNYWYLENPNYYPIDLTKLTVQAYMNKQIAETPNISVVTVPIRSKLKIYATLEITFSSVNGMAYYAKFCNDHRPWVHTVYMRFQATAVVNIFGYNFTSIVETFPKVSCGRNKTTTVAPPTTTTPRTTTTTSTTSTTTTSTTSTTTSPTTTTSTTTTAPTTPARPLERERNAAEQTPQK